MSAANTRWQHVLPIEKDASILEWALTAAGVGVYEYDVATGLQRFSPACKAIWGLAPEEDPTPARIEALIHPDDREAALRKAHGSLRPDGTGDFQFAHRIVRPDGVMRWIEVRGRTEFDDHQGIRRAVRSLGVMLDVTAQKADEQAEQQRQRQMSIAMRGAGAGVWSWDAWTNEVTWSAEQYALYEFDPTRPVRFEDWAAALHPEDRPRLEQFADALRTHPRDCEIEFRIATPRGERWLLAIGQMEKDPHGNGARYVGMNLDITAKKSAEQELRRLHEQIAREKDRLALVLDNITEEVWFHDVQGRLIFVNSAGRTAFGDVAQHDVAGFAASVEILRPDGSPRPPHEFGFARAVAGGEIRDLVEVVKLPASGELRTRSVTLIPARGPDGAVLGVVTVARDITKQAAADRALEMNRSRLEYATRVSGIGFWYCDLPFDELQWDPRVKEHFFIEPTARVTIDDFYSRIHPEDRAPTRDAIDASIHSRAPYDFVYRTVHPQTGEIKWIRALGGTDYASDGTPTHFDGVTVDISAQKLAEQRLASLNDELLQQDRLKDEFIATLSHELRNPLAPIRAAAKVIAAAQVAPEQVKKAQSIIERQVTHMALLLDDLLDVARITQGKLQLKKCIVALTQVVDAAVEAVRPTINDKRQRLSVRLPPEPVLLDADALRLSQILSNLLMNAAKYSDSGSHIALAAGVEETSVTLRVKDEGIGIAPEAITKIFRMFSQIEDVTGRSDGGLGIGLALVKGLTELHGGTVEARSDGLGHGSEFTVRLPLAPSHLRGSPAVVEPRAPPVPRRILIADDNKDSADSVMMLLELAGHEVRVAYLGRAALSLARSFRPDIALLDIGMPDLNGYEVAQQLRREPWASGIQLIAVTGWGQENDRRRALQAGFDHHLIKPVNLDHLEALLTEPRHP